MTYISPLQDDSEQRRSYILSSFLTEIILALKEVQCLKVVLVVQQVIIIVDWFAKL